VSCSTYPLVSAFDSGRRRAVCKTVGSAYVGSNPNTCHHLRNGPLAAETRPRGCFRSCHVAYQSVSLCVEVSRYPRTYSGRRPGRLRGRGHRWLSTDGHGRPRQRGLVPAQVRCRCHAPPDGRHRPGRAGAAAAEGRAVRQTVASAARGASGQLLYWRGCPSRTALTERDSPGRPGGPDPSRSNTSGQKSISAALSVACISPGSERGDGPTGGSPSGACEVAGWAWPEYKDLVVACRRCGASREDGDRFCADCGVPLGRGGP
jgi:hypothetical protein